MHFVGHEPTKCTLNTQTVIPLRLQSHLTLASVAANVDDPHVAFVPVDEPTPDVDLRAAWRRNDPHPAVHTVLGLLFDEIEGEIL